MQIFVVLIRECIDIEADSVDAEAFASREDAEAWINDQISTKIKEYNLDADAVDGWRVVIGDNNHSLEYEIKECPFHGA